jgi:uncharacterized protein YfaP (DUF2135 family)
MPSIRAAVALAAVGLLVALAGCTGDEPEPTAEPPRSVVNDYVTDVRVVGQQTRAEVRTDALPEGSAGGPDLTARTEATVVNGGSLLEPVRSTGRFTRLRVAVDPADPSGAAFPGYVEVALPAAAEAAQLVVSVAQGLPDESFALRYAAVAADGTQGRPVRERISVLAVGTGQVQITVSWDADSDVDLHVLDPYSDEVFFQQPEVDSGGVLDLDSNAECTIDHKRNENITWAAAPPGPYEVRISYWSNCGVPKTTYVVTVRVTGQPTKVYNGEFTGPGDEGGLGSGRRIASFTVAGPTPTG